MHKLNKLHHTLGIYLLTGKIFFHLRKFVQILKIIYLYHIFYKKKYNTFQVIDQEASSILLNDVISENKSFGILESFTEIRQIFGFIINCVQHKVNFVDLCLWIFDVSFVFLFDFSKTRASSFQSCWSLITGIINSLFLFSLFFSFLLRSNLLIKLCK